MSFSSDTTKTGPLLGDGSNTSFGYEFLILAASHLQVIHTDNDGIETILEEGTHYSVDSFGDSNGGTITYPLSGSPLSVNEKLTLRRNPPFTQGASFSLHGGYIGPNHETVFDTVVMQVLYLKEELSRAVKVGISTTDLPDELLANITQAVADSSAYATTAASQASTATGQASIATSKAAEAANSATIASAAAQGWAAVPAALTVGTHNIEVSQARSYFIIDASGGAVTINLPAIGANDGLLFGFEVSDASNAITIVRDGTDLINGVAGDYVSLESAGDVVHFIGDDKTPDSPTDNWLATLIGRITPGDGLQSVGNVFKLDRGAVGTWSGAQRSAVVTDNDGSFDMPVGNDFSCTPAAPFTFQFTNPNLGQHGLIYLDNSAGHAVAEGANIQGPSGWGAALSGAGKYAVSYWCHDGTKTVISYMAVV